MSAEHLFLGVQPNYLDLFVLEYRWFGAVWNFESNHRTVYAFWFGENKDHIIRQAAEAGWKEYSYSQDEETVRTIYAQIRAQQREYDWRVRSRLPLKTIFVEPWRNVQRGWCVIRSRDTYPFYVCAMRRKRFTVWIEHVALCETEPELQQFLHHVQLENGIALAVANLINVSNLPGKWIT